MKIEGNTPRHTTAIDSHNESSKSSEERLRDDTKIREKAPLERKREVFRREVIDGDKIEEARKAVQEELERLRKLVHIFDRRYDFLLHESTNRIFVKVIDVTTDTVIREIPPEELLNLMARIHNMVGLLFDERV